MIVQDEFSITGRGLVFLVSLKVNKLSPDGDLKGHKFEYKGKQWEVRGVEARRGLGGMHDNVGLLVREIKKKRLIIYLEDHQSDDDIQKIRNAILIIKGVHATEEKD